MIKLNEVSKPKFMDTETFTKLYKEHYSYLYGYALKLTKNVDNAQDLMQNAYYNVYISKKNSLNTKNFKSYMKSCILNEFRKSYKKIKKDKKYIDTNVSPEDIPSFMEDPEEFNRLVKSLDDKIQTMYNLRYKDLYTEKEIAEILHMKEGTVRSIFSRTNKKLAEMLKKLGIAILIFCVFVFTAVAAVSLISYLQNIFRVRNENLENKAVLDAIENNGWFQKADMDYVDLGNGYKIKLDYFLLDEMCLYMVFDLESEKDLTMYNELSILDLKVENENGETICDFGNLNRKQYQRINGTKTIEQEKHHMKQLLYMYTDSFPISNSLNIKFSKIVLHKRIFSYSTRKIISCNFDLKVNIAEHFKNRTYTGYISDNENLRKAIICETGFYAIVASDNFYGIDAKLFDSNNKYDCFTPMLTNYDDTKNYEYIIVSEYNNKNSKYLKLIIDGIEYELKNQP